MSHTGIGQGVWRRETPNLSVCVNTDVVSCENTFGDLGSNYRILNLVVGRNAEHSANLKVRIAHLDKFHKNRDNEKEDPIKAIGS
ncbi:hypothetical protein MRX96_017815 [Rhipicephalus microplus]